MKPEKIFPPLVLEEAKNLRKYAKKEEINRLEFRVLYSESRTGCVYGQMTGDCFSERAQFLIENSCSKVYKAMPGEALCDNAELNGPPKKYKGDRQLSYWSPIEVFISKNAKENNYELNEELVKFIKAPLSFIDKIKRIFRF